MWHEVTDVYGDDLVVPKYSGVADFCNICLFNSRRPDENPVDESDWICSCHFIDGETEYGPSLHPWKKRILVDR